MLVNWNSFITGASKGWKQSKTKSKVKASQVKVGNRKGMQSVLKGAGKQAIKAAIVRGSKAVGVYGFVGRRHLLV